MIGFWFLEVSSLVFVFMLFNFFFSGQMFPLDMLPGVWGQVVKRAAAAVPGLLSRRRVPGQDHRPGAGLGPVDRAGLGGGFWSIAPAGLPLRRAALQRLRRITRMSLRPAYFRVFLTFARNSLVRDMTFRGNFLIETVTSLGWMLMNLAFYVLIFHYTPMIGADGGWGKYQFFLFFATGLLINSLVQTLFMTNARRAERPDPHRRAGFRPAEADRHAVPRLAAADRLVVAGEFRLSGWCCWLYALVRLPIAAGAGGDACSTRFYVALRRGRSPTA